MSSNSGNNNFNIIPDEIHEEKYDENGNPI